MVESSQGFSYLDSQDARIHRPTFGVAPLYAFMAEAAHAGLRRFKKGFKYTFYADGHFAWITYFRRGATVSFGVL